MTAVWALGVVCMTLVIQQILWICYIERITEKYILDRTRGEERPIDPEEMGLNQPI